MIASDLFAPLEQIAPELARRLQPGVRFQVSRRTFTQIAAERLEAMKQAPAVETVVHTRLDSDDLRALREAAAAQPLISPAE